MNVGYVGDSSPASRSAKFSKIAVKHISHFGIGLRFQRAPVSFRKARADCYADARRHLEVPVTRLGSTSHDMLENEVAKCYLMDWR